MELLGNKDLKITQDSLKYAGIIAAKINDKIQRKRAYASIIALDVFSDELARQGFEVNINKNLFKIAPVNEEFEFADIYCNGWKLDIRVANHDYVLIPKSHFKYDIAADFYVVVKMDKSLRNAVLVGYIAKDDISKTKSIDGYYVVEFSALKDYGELIENIKSINLDNSDSLSHDSFREAYLSFLDGDIDYVRKKDMIRHLRECEECRADFVEFFDFEAIVSKSKNFPAIFNDQTLDFIGGTAAENPIYEGKEQIVQIKENVGDSPAGQIVSDLFGASIEGALASGIPIAAAGVVSSPINEVVSSVNNFEDVLDKQETEEENHEGHGENSFDEAEEEPETFIEFFDGPTEDSISQEEDNIINFDEESVEDIVIGDVIEEDEDSPIQDSDETIDVGFEDESDEILDSDLDSIFDDEDEFENVASNESDNESNNYELEEDDDFVIDGLGDDILLESSDEDADDIEGHIDIEPLNADEIVIGDVHEGIQVPEVVMPEEDSISDDDLDGISFEDTLQETFDEEDEEDIQFIDSVDDLKVKDDVSDEEIEQSEILPSLEVDTTDEDEEEIRFINSADDIKINEEASSLQDEDPDYIEDDTDNTDEEEIEFIDDSNQGNQKQKYQEMFDYSDVQVMQNNTVNSEVISDASQLPSFDKVTPSFAEAMNMSDEDEIQTLYSENETSRSMNIPQMPQAVQNMQENSVDTKRLIVLASIVAGSLLVVSIVGFLMFSNINKHKSEQFNEQVNKVDSLDMGTMDTQNQPQNSEYAPAPVSDDNLNVTSTAPKDMNKAMTNVFDENASSVTVTKISWEVAKSAAQNPQIAKYLQLAGQNIVISLRKNLLNATEFSYNDSAKVLIVIGKDNNIKNLKVITSSGSEQIDEIVLQSIKETLTYINVPVLADSVQKELGSNAYTYKLVINF